MKYSKEEALKVANDFINEVNLLEKKYNMTFNSDTGDIYFSFKTSEKDKIWDHIDLGWIGDGSGIRIIHKTKEEKIKEEALSRLTNEERKVLGL